MRKFLIKENYESINLFNKINLLNENQIRDIEKGFDWTVKNYSNAVLIGGTALIHYLKGGRDLTPDIDFVVANISKLKSLLDVEDILYKPLRKYDNSIIGITVPNFNTDYLDANVDSPNIKKLVLTTYNTATIGGFSIKVVNPELLAIMKIAMGRNKDLDDGFALIQSGILNKQNYIIYASMLKNSLEDYESIISYVDMIQ